MAIRPPFIWGNPDAGFGFGNPDANPQIAFGVPATGRQCNKSIRCPGDDFFNYTSECDDVDYVGGDLLQCLIPGDLVNVFLRAPGFGPWSWSVGTPPPGVTFEIENPCSGILHIFGAVASSSETLLPISVRDGFGNTNSMDITFSVVENVTPTAPTPVPGTPYDYQLVAHGGSGHYIWYIVSGQLPDGINMTLGGHLTGTALEISAEQPTFAVIDTQCFQFSPPIPQFNDPTIRCPTGVNCGVDPGGTTYTLVFCDDTESTVTIPAGASSRLILAIIRAIIDSYNRSTPKCNPLTDGPVIILYANQPQSCTVFCPDGTPFTWSVPGGRYVSSSLAKANRAAFNAACRLANRNKVCHPPTPTKLAAYWTMDSADMWNDKVHSMALAPSGFSEVSGLIEQAAHSVAGPGVQLSMAPSPFLAYNPATNSGVSFWFWYRQTHATVFGTTFMDVLLQFNLDFFDISIVPSDAPNQLFYEHRVAFAGTVSGNAPFNPVIGQWYLIGLVWDKVILSLYVNGAVVRFDVDALPMPSSPSAQMNFNNLLNAPADYACDVDEFGLTMTAISPTKMTQIYNGGAGVSWPDIKNIV